MSARLNPRGCHGATGTSMGTSDLIYCVVLCLRTLGAPFDYPSRENMLQTSTEMSVLFESGYACWSSPTTHLQTQRNMRPVRDVELETQHCCNERNNDET